MDVKKKILDYALRERKFTFGIRFLEKEPEFLEFTESNQIESVYLSISGHNPIMNERFSIEKLNIWAQNNGLNVLYIESTPTHITFEKIL